ncbi:hypothetical protein BGZ63DRAFT_429442 [Mariannaea sp. PMI_226]|nr:hypothetical protein BGZ63DRAFT_429442 [Mariannaea sp. PMI_226]
MGGVSSARETLSFRIQVIHVGLAGNQIDGFRFVCDILKRVDWNVKKVLVGGLRIARILEEGDLRLEGDTVQLSDEEVVVIESIAPLQSSPRTVRFKTSNLEAGDDLMMHKGDLGFEAHNKEAGQQSMIDGVKVGNSARIHRGDVSKELRQDFLSAFWGSKSKDKPV